MTNELDALDPVPDTIKLSTGTFVELEALRSRQFFKLLRIITHGALPIIQDPKMLRLDPDASNEEFGTRLLSLVVLAIPDAEDECIEFIRSMCKPAGLIERRNLNKQDVERNADLWERLYHDIDNPELDDLITIIEAIVRREATDIQALGKRLASLFRLAQRTGQVPESLSQTSQVQTFSAGSPEPVTSYPTNMGGQTTSSARSHSVAFDNASPQSKNDASTQSGSDSNG